MSMSEGRVATLLKGQTTIAQKVYGVVPIQEPWTTQQIVGEMRRLGLPADMRALQGILSSLRETGLVTEPKRGHWMRAPMRQHQQANGHHKPEEPMPNTTNGPKTPIDKLADLSARVGKIADDLHALRREIDNVALEIASQEDDAETAKLKQLRKLLKELA